MERGSKSQRGIKWHKTTRTHLSRIFSRPKLSACHVTDALYAPRYLDIVKYRNGADCAFLRILVCDICSLRYWKLYVSVSIVVFAFEWLSVALFAPDFLSLLRRDQLSGHPAESMLYLLVVFSSNAMFWADHSVFRRVILDFMKPCIDWARGIAKFWKRCGLTARAPVLCIAMVALFLLLSASNYCFPSLFAMNAD